MQKIVPHLWFDKEAKEAALLYTTLFEHSRIVSTTPLEGTPSGNAEIVSFELAGQPFMAISAGPYFKFNPSISLMVACYTAEEVDTKWQILSEGGTALMELGAYPFSPRYGWIQDRYGLSWQLMLVEGADEGDRRPQKITPNLLFSANACGRAEEAVRFYTEIFDGEIGLISRYQPGEAKAEKAAINYMAFKLAGSDFSAMDNGFDVNFGFNEAFSLMVRCENQQEIDDYWSQLSADPEAEQCGWLKDPFGISWQIVPATLNEMMAGGTKEAVARVTQAFLGMKKFDLAALEKAYYGEGGAIEKPTKKVVITVETVVNRSLAEVWRIWTEPRHIMHWNSASEDWHTPAAVSDLRVGGTFSYTMAARDGSVSFDFGGTYDAVVYGEKIEYTIGDGRKVRLTFTEEENGVKIVEDFEAETMNSIELQKNGWQAILNHFKRYAESLASVD